MGGGGGGEWEGGGGVESHLCQNCFICFIKVYSNR